jgi:protein pelota
VVKVGATGSTNKIKMKINLTLRMERIEFDSEQCSLRVTGRNIEENEHVKVRLLSISPSKLLSEQDC